MGFKPKTHGFICRLFGVMLACLVMIDNLAITEAAGESHNLKEPELKVKEATVDKNYVLGLSLRQMLLLKQFGHHYVAQRDEKSGSQIENYVQDEDAKVRVKRWDFKMDGCHCDGYKIQCIHDSTCQVRRRSRYWKCSHTCCGFQCISYQRHAQNETRSPRNSTLIAQNSTRTGHSSSSTRVAHQSFSLFALSSSRNSYYSDDNHAEFPRNNAPNSTGTEKNFKFDASNSLNANDNSKLDNQSSETSDTDSSAGNIGSLTHSPGRSQSDGDDVKSIDGDMTMLKTRMNQF